MRPVLTNEIRHIIGIIGKILLGLLLCFLAFAVLGTYLETDSISKKLQNSDNGAPLITPSTDSQASRATLIAGNADNYSLGPENAKIQIVEFADFACPYCQKSFSKIRRFTAEYPQDIRFTFRDLPIVSEDSINLAIAARCAGEQGRFWAMHDRLFMNQGKTSPAEIKTLAKQIGVEAIKFSKCTETKAPEAKIHKDIQDALDLGLDTVGTPVWFINGEMVAGDIPEDIFRKAIEEIIR